MTSKFLLIYILDWLIITLVCLSIYVMPCEIWYHLYNLINVKNTYGEVLLLVKLQAATCNFTKSNILS